MSDILLNTASHELVIVNNDLVLAAGVDLIGQRIKQRLQLFLGEWYLDVTAGVPYFQEILIKGPRQGRVESILKATVTGTPGVTELLAFDLGFDSPTRVLTLTFTVRTDAGEISDTVELAA